MQNRSARLRRNRRRSSAGFIVPFLIILFVGIVLVLGFNLAKLMFSSTSTGSAAMHIENGSVELRTWRAKEFFSVTLDTKIKQGDEIKVSDTADVVLEMFDGTILRFAGGSDILFEKIDDEAGEVEILLVDGSIWINKVYKKASSNYDVKVGKLKISVPGKTIVSIDSDSDRHVAVISGDNINVDVFNKESDKVVDSVAIGIGQQAMFSDAVMDRYWKYQSPNVLLGITDQFKATNWYKLNLKKDKTPTAVVVDDNVFEDVDPIVLNDDGDIEVDSVGNDNMDEKNNVDVDSEFVNGDDEDVNNEEVDNDDKVSETVSVVEKKAPSIISVNEMTTPREDGYFLVDVRLATLKGAVAGAKSVTVNGYTLSKFKDGDTEWVYYANADHALMVPGKNTYEVYATYGDGTRSETTFINVLFEQKFESDKVEEPVENTENSTVVENFEGSITTE